MKHKKFDFFEKRKQEQDAKPSNRQKYTNINEREQDHLNQIAIKLQAHFQSKKKSPLHIVKLESCHNVLNILCEKFGFYPVKRTALFFLHNHQEDFIPEIKSITGLKIKFKDLNQIASRATRTSEIFSEEETKLKNELLDKLDFHGILVAKLPYCLQKCFKEYRKFYNKFLLLKERLEPTSRLRKFINFLEEAEYIVPSQTSFVKQWIITIHSYFENWKDWDPKISPYEFTFYSEYFEKIGYKWSTEYSCNPDLWNDLIREIIYIKSDNNQTTPNQQPTPSE